MQKGTQSQTHSEVIVCSTTLLFSLCNLTYPTDLSTSPPRKLGSNNNLHRTSNVRFSEFSTRKDEVRIYVPSIYKVMQDSALCLTDSVFAKVRVNPLLQEYKESILLGPKSRRVQNKDFVISTWIWIVMRGVVQGTYM